MPGSLFLRVRESSIELLLQCIPVCLNACLARLFGVLFSGACSGGVRFGGIRLGSTCFRGALFGSVRFGGNNQIFVVGIVEDDIGAHGFAGLLVGKEL